MASVLYQSIETLSRDKGIEPAVVVGAVEDAIALATRKYYKTQENMRAEMDRETGEIRAYVFKTVVESPEQVEDDINQMTLEQARELAPEVEVGGELRFYKDTTPLGRIAAQMAKQVIFQKVREAERDTVFNEYNHRAGEVLNATVKRLEPMDVIFDLGKAEARMPKREQSRLEQFAVGERVRVVLLRVDRAAKGPQVIVSRAARPSRSRNSPESPNRSTAISIAFASAGAINIPFCPCSTMSGMPQVSVVITGIPLAIASSMTDGNPSTNEGNKKTSCSRYNSGMFSDGTTGRTMIFRANSAPKNCAIVCSGTPHPANVMVIPGSFTVNSWRASRK